MMTEILRTRVFLEGGVLEEIEKRAPVPVVVLWGHVDSLLEKQINRFPNVRFIPMQSVMELEKLNFFQKALSEADSRIDKRFGFYPLAIRFNIKHGFNTDRLMHGSYNTFYDLSGIGFAPNSNFVYKLMYKWYFSGVRFFHPSIPRFLRSENIKYIVVNNTQTPQIHPFIYTARKMRIKVINYVASWDHPVSKGLFARYYDLYLVQNRMMKEALVDFHGIEAGKIVITGWPQMDCYSAANNTMDYAELLLKWGLDPYKPSVLLAGNSFSNAPSEPDLFEKIINWRDTYEGVDSWNAIVRPHPNDYRQKGDSRFSRLKGRKGVYIQENSLSDIQELAALLRNVSCVVCSGGTVLLDSIVNDRPVIGVTYDEGAKEGSNTAIKNFTMSHYDEIVKSGSFYWADNFVKTIDGIVRSLARPDELADQRAIVAKRFALELDGKAAKRLVDFILEIIS